MHEQDLNPQGTTYCVCTIANKPIPDMTVSTKDSLNSETQASCYHFREKRTHFPGLIGSYDFELWPMIDQY